MTDKTVTKWTFVFITSLARIAGLQCATELASSIHAVMITWGDSLALSPVPAHLFTSILSHIHAETKVEPGDKARK